MSEVNETQASPELIEQVRNEMSQSGLSQNDAAKQIDIKNTTISQWLRGIYPGDNDKVNEKVACWLSACAERRGSIASMPAPPAWVETPTAKKISATFSYAQMAGVMGIVYGGAGVGKTVTSKHYAKSYPNVWHVELMADAGGKLECAREICEVMGLTATGNASQLRRDIVSHAKGSLGLLIIDEAQFLKPLSLEMMRGIWRQAGIGVVLVGNEVVYAQLTGGQRAASFAQLFSRISKKQRLNKPLKGDVFKLADAWNVQGKKERDLLWNIANKNGALRSLTEVLRLASMYAADEVLSGKFINAAWQELGGMQ